MDTEYRESTNSAWESPIPRDASHLPENDYSDDYDIAQLNEPQQQQLERRNRNLLPVSERFQMRY